MGHGCGSFQADQGRVLHQRRTGRSALTLATCRGHLLRQLLGGRLRGGLLLLGSPAAPLPLQLRLRLQRLDGRARRGCGREQHRGGRRPRRVPCDVLRRRWRLLLRRLRRRGP